MAESACADFCVTVLSDLSVPEAAEDRECFFLVYCSVTASGRSCFSNLTHTVCHSSRSFFSSVPCLLLLPPLAHSSPLLDVFLISTLQAAPVLQSVSQMSYRHTCTNTECLSFVVFNKALKHRLYSCAHRSSFQALEK